MNTFIAIVFFTVMGLAALGFILLLIKMLKELFNGNFGSYSIPWILRKYL